MTIHEFLMLSQCTCPCLQMRDSFCTYMSGNCYQPICPIGTFLCCATCLFSTCHLNGNLALSTRGLHECIICPPGHYCHGCDLPFRCPANTINRHVGMSKPSDCTPCPSGFEATQDKTQCCLGATCTLKSDEVNYFAEYDVAPSGCQERFPNMYELFVYFGLIRIFSH